MVVTPGDPERVLHKNMTESPLYGTVIPHKASGMTLNTAAAIHDMVVATIDVQKAHQSQAGSKVVENEKMTIKTESFKD